MSNSNLAAGKMATNFAATLGRASDNYGVLSDLEETHFECEESFFIDSYRRNHETTRSRFKISYLIEQLEWIDKYYSGVVAIEISNDGPISIIAGTEVGDCSIAMVAPILNSHDFESFENHMFGYFIRCQDCSWRDQYYHEEKAEKALNDHIYFEGHEVKAFDSSANEVNFDE